MAESNFITQTDLFFIYKILDYFRLAGRGMETTSQEYDMDDVMVSRAATEGEKENEAARDRAKAISEHKKLSKILGGCKYCFGTKTLQKHLMVAIGRTW